MQKILVKPLRNMLNSVENNGSYSNRMLPWRVERISLRVGRASLQIAEAAS